ncbi:hypothetical protein D3C81_1920070 [compost metagenome]
MLRRQQSLVYGQRFCKSGVAGRTGRGLDAPWPSLKLYMLYHQRYLPAFALLLAMCHPIIGKTAQAMVDMHRAQGNIRLLLAQ